MSFKDLDIRHSYVSQGENNMVQSFIVPVMKQTVMYRRSVGFFSSSVFSKVIDGVVAIYRNHGKIQMIASPKLSQEDIDAIQIGYKTREKILKDRFSNDFQLELDKLDSESLKLLAELIAKGVFDIKIAVTNSFGMYHDKMGIFEDANGDKIVFYGSPNSSRFGYQENYERIRTARSWIPFEDEVVCDEVAEFTSLWNHTNEFVDVLDYKECARKDVFNVINNQCKRKKSDDVIVLRDYQKDAIQAWVSNNYQGFFIMATGTGKTWTAIFAAKRLVQKHPAMIVICAPYKHLIKQWCEDLEKAFPEAVMIMSSSENPEWDVQISDAIIKKRYRKNLQIIVVSTIATFSKERFSKVITKSNEEKMLIVDEAHRFTERDEELKDQYNYLLGLSATPYSGRSAIKGKKLMEFFGGKVFDLPIESALEKGFLVPYKYHPIYVYSTPDEEDKFNYYSKLIASCFRNGICINPDLLVKSLRNRLRVISMSNDKEAKLPEIIKSINQSDHFVVYCGDGKTYDNNGEEIRHIQAVKRILTKLGYKASQFTAQEKMKERMQLVNAFNKGDISSLAAIRCLDEGINIPSIQCALILSSNDDYREFVQRRGRILRTYKGKEVADIYDVVVLPTSDCQGWAKIEFRRFYEYAKLAQNWSEIESNYLNMLKSFGLTLEDVSVYDYENMEDTLYE